MEIVQAKGLKKEEEEDAIDVMKMEVR